MRLISKVKKMITENHKLKLSHAFEVVELAYGLVLQWHVLKH